MTGDLHILKVIELLTLSSKQQRMPFGKHRGQLLKDIPKSYVKWLNEKKVFDKKENQLLKDAFIKLGTIEG